MNHKILVCMLYRFTNKAKQAQAFENRKILFVTVCSNGQAVDVLHHEPGMSLVGGSAVDKARDKRMFEICQNLPFQSEPAEHEICVHSTLEEFDGNLLVVLLVVTNANVDRSHA